MIPQVSLSRPTPVVVAPFGASGIKFATEVISGFTKAGIDASIDRRIMPLAKRIRTLQEAGSRIFCGIGDEEVRLQMVRLKIDDNFTKHMNIGFAIDFIKADLERETAHEHPAEEPRPPTRAEPSEPAEEVMSLIVRRADGKIALRGVFDPEAAGDLMEFFRGMAALGRRHGDR